MESGRKECRATAENGFGWGQLQDSAPFEVVRGPASWSTFPDFGWVHDNQFLEEGETLQNRGGERVDTRLDGMFPKLAAL